MSRHVIIIKITITNFINPLIADKNLIYKNKWTDSYLFPDPTTEINHSFPTGSLLTTEKQYTQVWLPNPASTTETNPSEHSFSVHDLN